jgi:pimeloyl-ACP methyl ester carboxylesterase
VTAEADDEFGWLADNADEAGIPWAGRPTVRRAAVDVAGRVISGIVWGDAPEAVFFHGGAQNAHTWDTVALALQRPIVALDLPGHGHSDWRPEHDYAVTTLAADAAPGASHRPSRGRPSAAADAVAAFIAQHDFATLEEMLERTRRYASARSEQSVRRGVLHNGVRRPDGSWSWRWDPALHDGLTFDAGALERALSRFSGRVLLVRGARSDIVTDDTIAAFTASHPPTEAVTVDGAGHALQGDRPVELARVLASFWDR